MNSMEHYHKNNPDNKPRQSSERELSFSRSWKLKQAFLVAVLGAGFLTGCGVMENRAKSNIEAAGIPPAVANDPDLIWAAMNGASAEELRDYANTLSMKQTMESNWARETQMAIDEANQLENSSTIPEEKVEAPIDVTVSLEQVTGGVYAFRAPQNMEVTSHEFMREMQAALNKISGTEPNIHQILVAVADDDHAITRIFMDSTVDAYKDNYGNFYAYVGDNVYVATDGQALNKLLDDQGIPHKTFGLP